MKILLRQAPGDSQAKCIRSCIESSRLISIALECTTEAWKKEIKYGTAFDVATLAQPGRFPEGLDMGK